MNVNIENPSALRRKLTIELEPDEIKTELDRAYNDLRRNVVLKGFRPGHAPRTMLERLFGDQVRGEIVQKLIKEYTDKALEEQNLKPLLSPEIVTEESDLAKALRFSAIFDLRPEIVVRTTRVCACRAPRSRSATTRCRRRSRIARALGHAQEGRGPHPGRARRPGAGGNRGLRRRQAAGRCEDRTAHPGNFPDRLAHGLDEVLTGAEVGQPAHRDAQLRGRLRREGPRRQDRGMARGGQGNLHQGSAGARRRIRQGPGRRRFARRVARPRCTSS